MDGVDLELFERSLRSATERATGAALDAALAEIGWRDALAADVGAGVSTLFELQGRANATSSALGAVVAHAVRVDSPAVVLPGIGGWHPPGTLDAGRLRVAGLGAAGIADHETALVVARHGEKDVAVVVPTAELTLRSVSGLDPWLGLVEIGGEVAGAQAEPVPGWDGAVALAQLALAHELVGASRTMLELARTHALERVQFGQPIAAFQAVRHRLADALVAIETADAVLAAAWDDGSPVTAAMAKALAGRGARTVARHCQQVLAGIGFTTEHPLHRFVRRVLVLDELFGAARTLTGRLGEDLLRERRLPPLLPL